MTLVIPAAAPTKKNIIINQGLLSNQLSKIYPIIVPTNTAATISVLNFKAIPKEAGLLLSLFKVFLSILAFAIFRRVFKLSDFFIQKIYATNSSAF